MVGDRYSWTMEDVMEVLNEMPEGSTILRYNMTKRDAFFNLLRFSLDRFVELCRGVFKRLSAARIQKPVY